MITPDQAAEAVKKKQAVYRLGVYETSESRLEGFVPVNVAYGEDGWIVTRMVNEDPSGTISLNDIFLTKQEAWVADAERLEAVAVKCERIAKQLRQRAKKESEVKP